MCFSCSRVGVFIACLFALFAAAAAVGPASCSAAPAPSGPWKLQGDREKRMAVRQTKGEVAPDAGFKTAM
jgi:hypothetical protein